MFEYITRWMFVEEAAAFVASGAAQGYRLHTCEPTGDNLMWLFIVMERPAVEKKGEESTPMPMKG